jgi:hypothetical protein
MPEIQGAAAEGVAPVVGQEQELTFVGLHNLEPSDRQARHPRDTRGLGGLICVRKRWCDTDGKAYRDEDSDVRGGILDSHRPTGSAVRGCFATEQKGLRPVFIDGLPNP